MVIIIEYILMPSTDTALADRLAQVSASTSTASAAPASPQPDRRTSTPDRQQRLALQGAGNSDLADAQKARAQLEARAREGAVELDSLRAAQRKDKSRIADLSGEARVLAKKVKDRDEELRAKAKLLDVSLRLVSLICYAYLSCWLLDCMTRSRGRNSVTNAAPGRAQ